MLMLLSVHVTSVLFLFRLDYGLLLEIHALTLVTRSYALLTQLLLLCYSTQESEDKRLFGRVLVPSAT